MYPSVDQLKEITEADNGTRPIVMCEYAHAMGNSLGNLDEYWDLIRSNDRLMGGYIWDWIDQGLLKKADDGSEFLAYGGDYGDKPNSSNFCINGVVASDRTLKPGSLQCKYILQPVNVKRNGDSFQIENRYDFTDLNTLSGTYKVLKDGVEIAQGDLPDQDLAPQTSGNFAAPNFDRDLASEYSLQIFFTHKEAPEWIGEDKVVAYNEFIYPAVEPTANDSNMDFALSEEDGSFKITSGKDVFFIDQTTGLLSMWNRDGKEIMLSPLKPNFWRALTDNDRIGGKLAKREAKYWIDAFDKAEVVSVKAVKNESGVESVFKLPQEKGTLTVTFAEAKFGSGISVWSVLDRDMEKCPLMPRFGFQTTVPTAFDKTEYFGRGPFENYADRKSGAMVGVYQSPSDKLVHDYVRPQENGNHTDCRWISVAGEDGVGIFASQYSTIEASQPFNFSVWPYSYENLKKALHTNDLKSANSLTVNIDYGQMGVGGDNSWTNKALPMEKYRLNSGKIAWVFRLSSSKE